MQNATLDFFGLSYAIAIAGILSGVGIAIDKLLLAHQSVKIKDALLQVWNYVDEVRFKDVAHKMVSVYILIERRLFGKRFSARWFFVAISISTALTTATIIIGRALGMYLTATCADPNQTSLPFYTAVMMGFGYFHENVHHISIYPLNILFDNLTIAATVALLTVFLRGKAIGYRYFIIGLDIVFCVILLNVCFYIAFQLDTTSSGNPPTLFEALPRLVSDVSVLGCGYFYVYMSTIFFVSTITIPTLLYLLMILTLMAAKTSAEIGKFALLQLTELGVVGEKSVFFYTGIFLGLLVLLLKLAREIVKVTV